MLSAFHGEQFEALKSSGSQIVHVKAAIECARDRRAIPPLQEPLRSLCFEGASFISTGIKGEHKERLRAYTLGLGGTWCDSLHPPPTYVLADSTNTEKYQWAVGANVPVLKDDYVRACWERARQLAPEEYRCVCQEHALLPFPYGHLAPN